MNAKDLTVLKARDLEENDYFDEPAFLVDILQQQTEKEDKTKKLAELSREKIMEGSSVKKSHGEKIPGQEQEEIDLHVHEIVDDYRELSNSEILKIQLSRFETALLSGINTKTKRIVFIHGVGNGVLKHEMRNILDNKYPNLSYQDASFKEYGYGATMVYLRK